MKRKNNLRKSINESVKQFIMEFGSGNSEKAKENRKKMAMASKRAIDKGDDSVYHNSVRSITTGGGSKNDLADFNDDFEKLNSQPANNLTSEGRNQIKVSESQLFNIIEESVNRILNEIGDTQRGQNALGQLAGRYATRGNMQKSNDIGFYAMRNDKARTAPGPSDNYTRGYLGKGVKEEGIDEIGDTERGQYMLGRLQARDGNKSWKGSWEASGSRSDAAEKAYNNGKSYNGTYNRMLHAYRRGRNGEEF